MKTTLASLFAAACFGSAACFFAGESGIGVALLGLGGVLNLISCFSGPSPEAAVDGEE